MSSAQKSFAQINVRGKFLKAITTAVEFNIASSDSIQSQGSADISIIRTGASGQLYKDLGREVVVFDTLAAGAMKLAVYRQVQLVAGVSSEGVPVGDVAPTTQADAVYVKVWDARGIEVGVVRTG